MSRNGNGATTGKPVTARQASGGQGTSAVPQAPGQANLPGQSKKRQASTPVQPSKTYVGVIVYIDVDGTIKPERIALGNRLFGSSNVVDVKDVHNDDGGRSGADNSRGNSRNATNNDSKGNTRNDTNSGNVRNANSGDSSANASDILTKDYTVEIWNGKGKTRTSHLFMENSRMGIRWYVMQKAKAGASV